MNKYQVGLEGEWLVLEIENKLDQYGFYTTRFIEADSEDGARQRAVAIVAEELKGVVQEKNFSPKIKVKELVEIESFEDIENVPGSGFSWYPMKNNG